MLHEKFPPALPVTKTCTLIVYTAGKNLIISNVNRCNAISLPFMVMRIEVEGPMSPTCTVREWS